MCHAGRSSAYGFLGCRSSSDRRSKLLLCRPLYMSTKNTILKAYDGSFLQIFKVRPAINVPHPKP